MLGNMTGKVRMMKVGHSRVGYNRTGMDRILEDI